jgi:hypothetical protein
MGFIDLAAAPLISPAVLGMVAIYLLLKRGLRAATRPESTKAQVVRYLVASLISVVCMIAASRILT